ncbi:armadillo-type protein [Dissophora ornata]|nr:armadillo-type protein [Dissophora ornata]
MGHSATGYDPNFINQQYTHSSQQQQQQQQQHQGLPPHRNNYRRHSDKPVHLDYQMCVDRILQATDQQASIHLQQKLKTSPPEQKIQIIDAILGQAFPLMSNRFGNFLIQRCFEFGSPQQIDALAQAMRGNILTLACDPFGCHVVQKALDNVEEDCKARIVTEMFRRIRETIVHRYACHVWQKVFEIRWTDAPPAVMTYVNNAVSGRWASVAVDETGSLVVQNIFENCAEHDKRPVLNEILQSVTTIAKGQWGNWVIQHILEHGAPADRATVTQKILEDAVNLSLDQYASKVVEKTLRMAAMHSSSALPSSAAASASGADKSANNSSNGDDNETNAGGPPSVTVNGTTIRLTQEEVLNQYIHIVCDGVQDRPRIPLIDIAADQYGNYIVQYILTNAGPQHRETCAALIKRHMVSLRGSKYGQKVAFMVERWRGSPFSGSGSNGGNGGGSQGSGSYGSKSGSGPDGGNGSGGGSGGGGGGRRQRW